MGKTGVEAHSGKAFYQRQRQLEKIIEELRAENQMLREQLSQREEDDEDEGE